MCVSSVGGVMGLTPGLGLRSTPSSGANHEQNTRGNQPQAMSGIPKLPTEIPKRSSLDDADRHEDEDDNGLGHHIEDVGGEGGSWSLEVKRRCHNRSLWKKEQISQ